VLSTAGIWWVTSRDRKARQRLDELDALEAAAWEVATAVGRLKLMAPAIQHTTRSKLAVIGVRVLEVSDLFASMFGEVIRPYGYIKARRDRYPQVFAAVDTLMTIASDFGAALAAPSHQAEALAELEHRYEEAVGPLQAALRSLSS
jgi:hypothetical protein